MISDYFKVSVAAQLLISSSVRLSKAEAMVGMANTSKTW